MIVGVKLQTEHEVKATARCPGCEAVVGIIEEPTDGVLIGCHEGSPCAWWLAAPWREVWTLCGLSWREVHP